MSNRKILVLLCGGLFGALATVVPPTCWADTYKSANGTLCDDNILGLAVSSSTQAGSNDHMKHSTRWERDRALFERDKAYAETYIAGASAEARAVYERDLEYAKIDSEQSAEDYAARRDLIEAKYRLALAEIQLITPNFNPKVITDLRQAKTYIEHALKGADAKYQARIKRILERVNHLHQFVSQGGGCWSDRFTEAFDRIDNDIEHLLRQS